MNTNSVTREALSACKWALQYRKQSPIKPEIYFLEWQNQSLCVKDFSRCSNFVRSTIGRWIVNKEAYVLDALEEIAGVPKLTGVIDGPALVMERLDASSLPKPPSPRPAPDTPLHKSTLTPNFFNETSILLATLHDNGITHGDIHSNNLLVHGDGRPLFIDFAAAVIRGKKASRLKCWAWRTMVRIDQISVVNLRQKHFPDHPLTSEEAALLETQPKIYLLHNKLRVNFLRPIKRFFRSV